jgi:hypothetical protein
VSVEPVDPDRFMIGVLGPDPTLLNTLETLQIDGSNSTVVRHLTIDALPEQALALRSLNALFIHDVDTATLSPAQREAVRLWVALGGQLIIGGGLNGQRAASGLGDLLPADIGGGVRQADLSPLEALGAGQLPTDARQGSISELLPHPGAEDLSAGAGLIYRVRYGIGSISIAAFDLSQLRGWVGEPVLWRHAIRSIPLFNPGYGSRTNQTSLIETVLQIPGLGLPSPGILLFFLFGYIIVIGPINYVILRRLRKLEWAWLTVPVIVAAFSGGLYLVGFGLRGSQSQLNQVTIIQGVENQQQALATGFVALFSPSRSNYTVSFPPATLLHETRGWDNVTSQTAPVVISESGAELRDLLVDIASVQTLVAETPVDLASPVASQIQTGQSGPQGEIRNTSGETLDHALVVSGGAFVDLGDLAPGTARSFDFSGMAQNFPWAVSIPEEGLFNRKNLLNSLFGGDATLYPNGTGPFGDTGVYLVAWGAQPTLPVRVDGREQSQTGYTLYVIRLNS